MYNKEPDCVNCLPTLYEDNVDAINIWLMTKGQIITVGMGEIVDINHIAVWKAIDELKVENRLNCFNQVLKVFHHILEIQKNKSNDTVVYDGADNG